MGNFNIVDRIRQAYGLDPVSTNPISTPQFNPDEGQLPPQYNINIPPPDPALTNQALQDFSGLRQYTQNFPKQSDYQPSRLRRILADVAGVGMGIARTNPMAGEQTAEGIRQAPYQNAIQRYLQAETPYRERADIGVNEAKLAGMSAENLYRYLAGKAALGRVGYEQMNAETNRMKLGIPQVSTPYSVENPSDPLHPELRRTIRGIDTNTGKPYYSDESLGGSTAQNFAQRQALQQSKYEEQLELERRRELGMYRRRGLNASDANIRYAAGLNARRIQVNQGVDPFNALAGKRPADAQQVMLQLYSQNPELFDQTTTTSGGVAISLKKNLTPAQLNQFQAERRAIAEEMINSWNAAIDQSINQVKNSGSNYTIENVEPTR